MTTSGVDASGLARMKRFTILIFQESFFGFLLLSNSSTYASSFWGERFVTILRKYRASKNLYLPLRACALPGYPRHGGRPPRTHAAGPPASRPHPCALHTTTRATLPLGTRIAPCISRAKVRIVPHPRRRVKGGGLDAHLSTREARGWHTKCESANCPTCTRILPHYALDGWCSMQPSPCGARAKYR